MGSFFEGLPVDSVESNDADAHMDVEPNCPVIQSMSMIGCQFARGLCFQLLVQVSLCHILQNRRLALLQGETAGRASQ